MGDDTWMSVFPDSFQPNMTFPYDSFNVEDLHTVDEGVIKNIFPLLHDKTKPFDFLIGHFLGVDHVGHRVGLDHPSMLAKLKQMNQVLTSIVELLDDDTLLVVLGDHGMDRSGDHGGDGVLETSSGLWIYSKGPALSEHASSIPPGLLQYTTFPDTTTPHRLIQQIDLLPTLSLLLGLPIPFNNLGTVIPELFWRDRKGTELARALEFNTVQIKNYLDTYRASPSGGELDDAWPDLQSAWMATQAIKSTGPERLITLSNYNRVALAACRSMWAQFNALLMGQGLVLLGIGIVATWAVYSGLSQAQKDWDGWLGVQLARCLRGAAAGAVLGLLGHISLDSYLPGIDALDCILFAAPFISSLVLIVSSRPMLSAETLKSIPVPLILHAIAFLSNSFTFWEDRIVPFLILSSIVPSILTGFTAPTSRLRSRILGFSFLFALCVRLMSISTVCREEQQPYCHVTFYASSSLPSPPLPILLLAVPTALCLPWAIKKFLSISRSDMGVAKTFLPWVLRPALLAGSGYWVMEWADSTGLAGKEWTTTLRAGRTGLARLAFGSALLVGATLWWLVPLCLDIIVDDAQPGQKRQVKVIGHANAFGSPYLIFWTISLSLVYTSTQLTGQVVLALATIALMAHLEVVDSVRDVKSIEAAFASSKPSALLDLTDGPSNDQSPTIKFADVVPIALLGLHAFYGTGHQSIISSIQWKSAFLLTSNVTYPFSPLTVVLNSFGPLFLVGLAAPLLALWNRAPLLVPPPSASSTTTGTQGTPDTQVKRESTLAALGIMVYYASLLLGTAVSAAVLRRHLMVWKVFAPRFMAAVSGVLAVDIAALVGVGVGVERIGKRVGGLFGRAVREIS